LLEAAEANLKKSKLGYKHIQPAGDFRRGCELVSDLSIVAELSRPEVSDAAAIPDGELNVYISDAAHYGATLLWATGSKAHLDQLCAYAGSKGYSLDRDGLHKAGKMRLSPLDPTLYQMQVGTGFAHLLAGRFDEASSWAEKSFREEPNYLVAAAVTAASHALAGRLEPRAF
jgi:DNA polymerase/3'-5' exonuclease PolX